MQPKFVIVVLLICIAIAACSYQGDIPSETISAVASPHPTSSPAVSPSPSPPQTQQPELAISPAYPPPTKSPGDSTVVAYPEPSSSPEQDDQAMPDCSPDAESGAVKGELHLQGEGPLAGSILYLAEYAGLESTNPIVVLDPARHTHTTTNGEGKFCFSKVPPGTYSLIVWNGGDSILLDDPSTDYSLQLEVAADETLETGVLYTPHP